MTLEPTAVFRSSHLCVRCHVTLSQIKAVVGYGALHTSPVVTNQIQQSITQIHTNTSLNPPTYQQTHWYTQWSHFTSDFLCSNSRWHLNRETVKNTDKTDTLGRAWTFSLSLSVTHAHTHVSFYGLRGLPIGVMVFILYKLYVLNLPYT